MMECVVICLTLLLICVAVCVSCVMIRGMECDQWESDKKVREYREKNKEAEERVRQYEVLVANLTAELDRNKQILANSARTCKKEQKSQRMISAEAKEALYNKNKPKFKVGDWVFHNIAEFVYMIKTIGRDGYGVISRDGQKSVVNYSAEINYHLWTIEDAKDGDVLNANGAPFIYKKHDKDYVYSYCGVNLAGEFIEENGNAAWNINSKVYPATKEQRVLLFKKMCENGYYWNAEKKELKQMKGGEE